MDHLRKAFSTCKYPRWAIDRVERRFSQLTSEGSNSANSQDTTGTEPTTTEAKTKGHIFIPYTQDLCKSIKKICSKYGIQTHFRGNKTIKNISVSPKDKDPVEKKEKWSHLLVPLWGACMWWGIYRTALQDLWRKIQGASEGAFTYTSWQ